MNNLPLVYIVVLNWNRTDETVACLDSLQHSTYPAYQILLIDNGSDDDSVWQKKYPGTDIEFIALEHNLGFAGGCNIGIKHAMHNGADFIWLVNNDATVMPDTLQTLVDAAVSDSKYGAVGSVLYYPGGEQGIQVWGGGRVNWLLGNSRHSVQSTPEHRLDYLVGASLLLRCSALKHTGLFDERYFLYWEDTDLCVRLKQNGWKLGVADNARVYHRQSTSLSDAPELLDYHFNYSAVKFFRSHAVFPLIPIVVGVLGRSMKRLLPGKWRQFTACLDGAFSALSGKSPS